MADVYSHAKETLIFLGRQTENSEAAIDFFQRAGQVAIDHGALSYSDEVAPRVDDFISKHSRDHPVLAKLDPLDAFLEPTVMAGHYDSPGMTLFDVVSTIMGCA